VDGDTSHSCRGGSINPHQPQHQPPHQPLYHITTPHTISIKSPINHIGRLGRKIDRKIGRKIYGSVGNGPP